MVITRLRRIKREIRVLGLASKSRGNRYSIIGVIYRGSLWLDGVLAMDLKGGERSEEVVEMVRGSPHHPQIRVILLDDELLHDRELDPYRLHLGAERPVIALSKQPRWPEPPEGLYALSFEMELGESKLRILSVGLRSKEAASVLRVATRPGETLPEALRVARLIAEALPNQKT